MCQLNAHTPEEKKLVLGFPLAGACLLLVVVASHVCEALQLLPWMDWGATNSAGHYLDLVSAISGLTLLSFGLLLRVIKS